MVIEDQFVAAKFSSSSRQRPVAPRIVVISLLLAITILALNDNCNKPIKCIQAQIYHRYEVAPNQTQVPSQQIVQSANQLGAADQEPMIRVNRTGRSIEFNSPIKRILELLSQHHHSPPVIVVSSDQNEQTSPVMTQSPTVASAAAAPLAMSSTASSDHQQQWTLVGANPVAANMDSTSSILLAQPQQLVQTSSIPYEQYFLTNNNNNNMMGGGHQAQQPQQFVMLPSVSPPQMVSYDPQQQPQIAYLPSSINSQQQHQFVAGGQQQQVNNNLEESVQPIFLSSYVPEVGTQTLMAPQQQPAQQSINSLNQQPNSIQQRIHQHPSSRTPERSTTASPEQPETDSENNHADDEPPEPSVGAPAGGAEPGGQDDDSAPSPNDQHGGSGPEQTPQDGNSSGSSSYEDKYDSDKDSADGPQTESSRNHAKTDSSAGATGDASSMAKNGLVNVGLNDDCMQCICRASSGCDQQLRCITRGSEEKYCGPFQLTEEYWNMAGSPDDSPTNFSSFEDCANDVDCAVSTVTNYMKKYHKDCDGDDNITCMDYARLHRLKQDECADTEKLVNHFDAYWARFQNCAEGYNRSRTGDDEFI